MERGFLPQYAGLGDIQEFPMAAKNLADAAKPAAEKPHHPRASRSPLDSRVRFEELVSGISTEFINLAPKDLDKGIDEVLKKIGKVAGVDHSAVFLFKNGQGSDMYEWCAPGIPSIKDKLQSIPYESYPWFMGKLNHGENILIRRIKELPPEAKAERALLLSLGVKSLVSIPMVLNNSLVGFLGFDTIRQEMTWSERTISLLKTVGEIFVSALERKRSGQGLEESESKYRALFEGLPVGLYRMDPEGKILDLNPAMVRMLGFENKWSVLGRPFGDFYGDPKDRDTAAMLMAKDGALRNFEFQMKKADGLVIWAQDNATAVLDPEGLLLYYEGSLLDITRQKEEESEIQDRRDQLIRHQAALLELAKMNFSDLESSFQRTTEIVARTLDVDRASIWSCNPGHTEITCQDLYSRPENLHDKGLVLKAREYPRYFKALEDSRVIAAERALVDLRTSEFAEAYLNPRGIVSMMDVPVRRQGEIVGILCCEHTGRERKWSLEEQQFAVSVGDAITLSLEASEGQRMERVNASIFRISEAANSAQNLQSLFQSIHQVVSGLMPAKNFYISLYDSARGLLSFPYFVDEYDTPPEPKPLGRGLTEYVLRTGQALLASPEVFADLEQRGEVESVGAPSIDWLGVPLSIDGQTIGVMVVQCYTESLRYTEEHKSILKFVCDQIAMVIHRKKTEEEVQERERFLSSMFESIQDGISILDEDYTILRVNKAMEKWYSHALPIIGKKCYEAYHLRDRICDICPTQKTIKTSEAAYEVVPKVGPGGEATGWLDLFSFPLIDKKTGQMKGVIEYVRDITERKKAEDRLQVSLLEKEVLLREIHHRVKNNMQVISSLLNLQSRKIQDSAVLDMFRESQRRIRSMALIHERLYQSSDLSRIEFSEYLRNLATHLFHSYQVEASRVQLRIEAEAVDLNINTAIPCGLIVNELVSNALKHGFPEGRSGHLQIDLHRVEGEGYMLRVTDDGVGFPQGLDFRKTETLGMQIVNTLASQIDASVELDQENGTRFTIHFQEVQYRQRT
jgi:PAS domain S-box-containing protein